MEAVTQRDKEDAKALAERAGIDLDDYDIFTADLAQTIASGRRPTPAFEDYARRVAGEKVVTLPVVRVER